VRALINRLRAATPVAACRVTPTRHIVNASGSLEEGIASSTAWASDRRRRWVAIESDGRAGLDVRQQEPTSTTGCSAPGRGHPHIAALKRGQSSSAEIAAAIATTCATESQTLVSRRSRQ
jgi:hypothetical protein